MAGAVSQVIVGCRLGAFACFQHAGVPFFFYAVRFVSASFLAAQHTPLALDENDRFSRRWVLGVARFDDNNPSRVTNRRQHRM
jgi:hypothetical protein